MKNKMKWWRQQPSSGAHQNRRTYAAVGHINPRGAKGPSMLFIKLLFRAAHIDIGA